MIDKSAPFHVAEGNYYTLTQVAELKQVYPQTVLYWVKQGWLPAMQLLGLGYIVTEQDALDFQVRRRARTSQARRENHS